MSDQTSPRFGRISEAERRGPLKRGALYKLNAKNPGLLLKAGGATIIDFWKYDEILAALPQELLPPRRVPAAQRAARQQTDTT